MTQKKDLTWWHVNVVQVPGAIAIFGFLCERETVAEPVEPVRGPIFGKRSIGEVFPALVGQDTSQVKAATCHRASTLRNVDSKSRTTHLARAQ